MPVSPFRNKEIRIKRGPMCVYLLLRLCRRRCPRSQGRSVPSRQRYSLCRVNNQTFSTTKSEKADKKSYRSVSSVVKQEGKNAFSPGNKKKTHNSVVHISMENKFCPTLHEENSQRCQNVSCLIQAFFNFISLVLRSIAQCSFCIPPQI